MDLNKIFGKFAGKEINVTEEKREVHSTHFGKRIVTEYRLDQNDPTMKEIFKTATENKLHVRTWLPGTFGTMDYRIDRVNVKIEPDERGTFRIAGFNLG